jgi:hypothetical protein
MMFRKRTIHGRIAAAASIVALATAGTLAVGASTGGASTPRAAATASPGVGVNGVCGTAAIAPIAPDLRDGHSESPNLRIFTEKEAFPLSGTLTADARNVGLYNQPASLPAPKPTIASGTSVNSYLLHMDTPGGSSQFVSATIGFTSDILGVQLLSHTLTQASSDQVHASGVTYPTGGSGLELVTGGTKDSLRILGTRAIGVHFKTSPVTDDVRVITRGTTSTATARNGYRMLAADGGVFDFGGQQFYGSTGNIRLAQPVRAGVNTCSNAGYWFVAGDGGVFSYGDAVFHGSLGGTPQASPIVAMAASPTGYGYYLAEANGAVRVFGDAHLFTDGHSHTDASSFHLAKPIVGMAATPTGRGYWLVASDGGIFSFGDAVFHGSTGNLRLVSPVVGMIATRTGAGYYMYAADGGIFAFGDAHFHGSTGGTVKAHPIVGMRLSASGNGYWFDDSAGKIFNFGDAAFAGDMSAVALNQPMIGIM